MVPSSRRLTYAVPVFLCATVFAADPVYTITPLGSLDGGSKAAGNSISPSGVVVGDARNSNNISRAFRWENGQMIDLIQVDGSVATAVSSGGQVVGIVNSSSGSYSFLYDGNQTVYLPPLAENRSIIAEAINSAGYVAGQAYDASNNPRAFTYYQGQTVQLADLGGNMSAAHAMSDIVIVGESRISDNSATRAAYWINGVCNTLGSLGGNAAAAFGINSTNTCVVGSSLLANNTTENACIFTGLGPINIGTLGGTNSIAYSANSARKIVGSAQRSDGNYRAFIYEYDGDQIMRDLNTLIPPDSGVILRKASAINDSEWIVAESEDEKAYLLKPIATPTPTPTPTPSATPTPVPSPSAPTITLLGKKKITTSKSKVLLRGTASGDVTVVRITVGRKIVTASGTSSWKATVRVKPGRTVAVIFAEGSEGSSGAVRVTILRK